MNSVFSLLHRLVPDELAFQVVNTLLIIVFTLALSKLASFVIRKILKPIFERTKNDLDDQILAVIESVVFRLLIVAGVYYASQHIENACKYISFTPGVSVFTNYPILKTAFAVFNGLLFTVFVFILLLMAFRLTTITFDWYAQKINAGENRNLSGSLFPLLKKVIKILLAGFAVAVVLSKFDVNVSGFIVSLGVGSLAVALAAQETISNMISGFIIMIDRPFRIGDRIKYAGTEIGDVVEIGIRSTKIMDFDNNIVIIPNNEIVKSRIVNFNYPHTLTRVVVDVGIGYDSDYKKAKEILLNLAGGHSLASKEFTPVVYLTELGDSAVNLRLVLKTDHFKDAFDIQCLIREQILDEFNKAGIEIPFPQRVLHIKNKTEII
jgi:small-conductance mechanosensitive channel